MITLTENLKSLEVARQALEDHIAGLEGLTWKIQKRAISGNELPTDEAEFIQAQYDKTTARNNLADLVMAISALTRIVNS